MRNLASVQKIIAIDPIEKADSIEVATVLGWKVVIKRGDFKVGDLVLYFEIDSMLPKLPMFEFMEPYWNEKLKAYRVKTIKLRGQISQGLIVPLGYFPDIPAEEDFDATDMLGIFKYEPPIPAALGGDVESFSWPITKTDEVRIQSAPYLIDELKDKPYYISVKLDGTSASFILDYNNVYHVCGRNCCYKQNKINKYIEISNRYNIEKILRDAYEKTGKYYALQGELVGVGIQGNKMNLPTNEVYFFNLVDVSENKKMPYKDLLTFCNEYDLKTVPIFESGERFYYTMEQLLDLAQGYYREDGFDNANPKQDREGIVVRSQDSTISFKVISNRFLLGKNND